MKLKIITVGRNKSPHYTAAAADYAERLAHYMPFEFLVTRDERQALKQIEDVDYLVVCDKGGTERTSEEMALFIDGHRNRGTKHLAFFIGGAAGIGEPILKRADTRLSFSKMTFPHELAQVILLEQIYRACTILKGEPYHK